jgi:cellulose synthase operon protein C
MGGVRNGEDASSAGMPPSGVSAEVLDMVERHRLIAVRLLREGQAPRAFGELVRASRALPMTPRLAAMLVAFSLRAGTEAAAITLLSSALVHTRGDTRRAVHLQLARLLRRVGQLPRAIEKLQALVDEAPGDRRARRLLEALAPPAASPRAPPPRKEEDSPHRHTTDLEIPVVVPPESPPAPRQELPPEEPHLESRLIARGAWRELARFYLAQADRETEPSVRAEFLTRLAEVLEDELEDPAGAARVYGQIVALTGDQAALAEQVRLLSSRDDGDDWAVRRALDEAVQRASHPGTRVAAYLARAERLLANGALEEARADFEAAESLSPGSLPALMGLARGTTGEERSLAVERLRTVLAAMPRRSPRRVEGLRCLARLAGESLTEAKLAHWAWTEVLAEEPEDVSAREQLLELARRLGDRAGVHRLLRARLAGGPRGPGARKAWLELVASLEADGDSEGALAELRQALRSEPGHREAWLLLVERLLARSQWGEAAWALEHAATATEDETERMRAWERLARHCREKLGDAARAQVYANRAEGLRQSIAEQSSPAPTREPPRGVLPRREPLHSNTVVLIPAPGARDELPASPPVSPASAPTLLEVPAIGEFPPTFSQAPAPPSAQVPVEGTQAIAWEAPQGKLEPMRRRARVRPASSAPAAPDRPSPAASAEVRPPAFRRVQEQPLDAKAYRELSAFFSSRGDTARGTLMAEVATALVGRQEFKPSPPRRTLSAEERAGLRHPGLRNPAGELLACVGPALCRLFPSSGRAVGSSEPLRPDAGPGARRALEVLESVARLLGVEVPEVCLAEEDGPPFALVHPGAPRLLVGRFVVRQAQPRPELRFFAGRALACLAPDLLVLRCVRKDQLLRAVAILSSVLRGGTDFGAESRVVREALHPRARERALELLEVATREFDAVALADAARHSANRAGLVASGGPGPAVAALRALKVDESELVELVRFAASERYLPLRDRGPSTAPAS